MIRNILESVRVAESFSTQRDRFVAAGADVDEVKRALDKFRELKDRGVLGPDEKDIDKYSTFDEVLGVLSTRAGAKSKTQKKAEGVELVHEDDDYKVYWIADAKAAQRYGKRTHWCISAQKAGPGHFALHTMIKRQAIYYAVPKFPKIGRDYQEDEVEFNKWAIVLDPDDDGVGYWDYADDEHASPPDYLEIVDDLLANRVIHWRETAPTDPSLIDVDMVREILRVYRNRLADGKDPGLISSEWVREAERKFLTSPRDAFDYARTLGRRWPEGEDVIVGDADYVYDYAIRFLRGQRWPAGEERILQDAKNDRLIPYAVNVIQGRWPELEKQLLREGKVGDLVVYASKVLKWGDRWPEAERAILDWGNWRYIYLYAKNVLHGPWPEAEKESGLWGATSYKNLYDKLMVHYKNPLLFTDAKEALEDADFTYMRRSVDGYWHFFEPEGGPRKAWVRLRTDAPRNEGPVNLMETFVQWAGRSKIANPREEQLRAWLDVYEQSSGGAK